MDNRPTQYKSASFGHKQSGFCNGGMIPSKDFESSEKAPGKGREKRNCMNKRKSTMKNNNKVIIA